MTHLARPLAVALLLAAFASHSFAQMGGGRHNRSTDSPSKSDNGTLSGPQTRAGQLNEKLGDLRLRLSITPAQSDLWQVFYSRVFELSDQNLGSRAALDGQTAPQATQERLAEAQSRAVLLQHIQDAVSGLYTALTPDQQRIADQYLPAVVP